ncbi:glycerol kinase [uncultured Paraglaciecola sp.]|uniref:glycerol kinase n=1 Tax=uncultured Paraglaciecola sp. TaxID=1765024 RepID=UPI00261572EF|nr:glycerol kinase [uncultured Paraglaciecola sp.]
MRESDKWALTAKGKLAGGRIKSSTKLGDYIEWPEDFNLRQLPTHQSPDVPVALISSTKIAKEFDISANKLNHLFSELGWISKSLKGWIMTEQGAKQGAIQSEDSRSGIPYVKWPATISQSTLLLSSINDISGASTRLSVSTENSHQLASAIDIRTKIQAIYSATDGHKLRCKAEKLIDNWLYMAEIVHAYERKLPIAEDIYCDFYIPTGNVYIEYWDNDDDPKYLARKEIKHAIYKKYGLKLIELHPEDVQNLDDILPRLLLKFGVQAY